MTTAEHAVREFVRRRRRSHDRRRLSDRLIDAYMWLFLVGYVVVALSGFVHPDLSPEPTNFFDAVAWLPLLLAAVVWGVLRFATWQGPVICLAPELQWVMSGPLSRRVLVSLKLRRAFVIAGAAGAAGGVVLALVSDVMIGKGLVSVFLVSGTGLAALALMVTALSWHVERSVRWSSLTNRLAPLAWTVLIVAGVGAARGVDTALWWSGPWGWVAGPVVAEAGGAVAGWWIQLGLLSAASVGAVVSAFSAAGRFSDEELWRRAEAHSAAAAALFLGDVRTIRKVARRERSRGHLRGRRLRMTRLGTPWLTVPARDMLALRRNPRVVVLAASLTAAAFLAAVAALDQAIFAIGAFIGLYAAASRLLEPVRVEIDRPDAHLLLPWPWGTVIVLHCVVPTAVLTVFGWIGLAVVGIGGFVPTTAVTPLVIAAPFAAAAIVTPAAISAARRPFPVESLISGAETGSVLMLVWMIAGPALAAIAVDVAFGAMREGLDRGVAAAAEGPIMVLTIATAAFVAWLWTRKPPE